MKIGLLGGSFDPVHLGHLLVAQAARGELGPFKPGATPAPGPERLRLLRLALAGETWTEVDDVEIRRGGVSYTVDTLRHYAEKFPGAEFFYLIGADQTAQLPRWREAGELARLAQFVVAPRQGESPAALPAPFRGQALRGFALAVSSSEIRARVKAGLPVTGLTPAAVAEAIANNRLYL